MNEGACVELTYAETVWKQRQSAVWVGKIEKPLFSETEAHTYPQTGGQKDWIW